MTTAVPPRIAQALHRSRRLRSPSKRAEGVADVSISLNDVRGVLEGLVTQTHAELILDGVPLDAKLDRKLDVLKFGSPVRSVTIYRDSRDPTRVWVMVDLLAPSTPSVRHVGGKIQWHFQGNDMA